MLSAWTEITAAVDPWLDGLTSDVLSERHPRGKDGHYTVGTLMQRVIYHYWYHTGENMAIRQMLGHTRLPTYVGNIDDKGTVPNPVTNSTGLLGWADPGEHGQHEHIVDGFQGPGDDQRPTERRRT